MNKIKIYIAEDNKLIREGIKSIFDDAEGFIISGAADTGSAAVNGIINTKPDIVLLDIGLPDMTGAEVIRRLSAEGSDSKVIILTGSADENVISEYLPLGIHAYILKDIQSDKLIAAVKSVYDGALWLAPEAARVFMGRCACRKYDTRSLYNKSNTNLTPREFEVLQLIVDGKSNNQIAEELCISAHTAKAHVCNIIQKLVVDDRTQAAVKALKEGLAS